MLRAKGIIGAKAKGELEVSLEALEALVDETVAAQNAEKDLSTKTLSELETLDDEFLEDDRMLEWVFLLTISLLRKCLV